ncbi:putative glucosylceramidase 4 [Armadillidium nasatum]|uniref:Glucosylceramidase n=1 Tax=Armadillidium nasatum TaxID=96803 RepID=A0A5N5T977_9CRUS|nr:putative glucosylceramidase 4 [Armadillidium nasatum]
MYRVVRIVFLLFLFYKGNLSTECTKRKYEFSSFVCVCDENHCNFDGISNANLDSNNVRIIKSSKDEFRNFEEILPRQDGTFNISDDEISIYINSNNRRQEVIGFGGAFTDAATMNIKSLSKKAQDNLLKMYFTKEGSQYNLVRVPIAGCDFSTHPYSYDDVEGDVDLVHFNLTIEDYEYKLPLIKQAIGLCSKDLYILTSPWSPPAWMKTSKTFNGSGELLPEMWQPYSNYLVKFFQMYEEILGTNLWGFTPQNEPLSGLEPDWPFNCCGWTAEKMRDWIANVLGPTLSAAGYRRLKLLIDDYNRETLPSYIIPIVDDPKAEQYVDGIAVHWYNDLKVGPEVLDQTHEAAPGKFILYTEACVESASNPIALGSWERGERYITNIIETANEFYVQPLYYALSHFSRNIERGATWISSSLDTDIDDLKVTALENPNGQIVVVVANVAEDPYQIRIVNESKDTIFRHTIEGKTWLTITYQK